MLGGGLQDDAGALGRWCAMGCAQRVDAHTMRPPSKTEGQDEVEDADAATTKPSRRKAADVNPTSTLRDAIDITLKDVDTSQRTDPLFHKMSAQFDASGPGGVLWRCRGDV